MSMFKFLKIIIICAIIFYFLFMIVDIRIFFSKVKSKSEDDKIDIKKVEKQLYLLCIPSFIFGIILGCIILIAHSLQSGDLTEFIFNFNYATSHYYKDVDRKELLTKAFDTVLEEMGDQYTQSLKQNFKRYIQDGVESTSGYSIMISDEGNIIVDKVKEDYIKNMGLTENDEIIQVNGISLKRNDSKRT